MEPTQPKNLKQILTPKIQSATTSWISNNHSRVNLCDFATIQRKELNNYHCFYHEIYSNKYLEYFNDEENTDFLIFENNKVYIDYSDNWFTFHKVDEQEKLIALDLDNQEIIDIPKHQNPSNVGDDKDKDDDKDDDKDKKEEDNDINIDELNIDESNKSSKINTKTDLVTLNYFPLCLSHCNITLCYDQDLPQVLSTELIMQLLQIYLINDNNINNSLVCGYDSLGGGCVINHLHFEFWMLDDIKNDMKRLPIENRESQVLLTTQLKQKNDDEISWFDENIIISLSMISEPVFCWKISCAVNKGITPKTSSGAMNNMLVDEWDEDNMYQNCISSITNWIWSKWIDIEIPHNLAITERGMCFYLFPRKFEKKDYCINSCWTDLSGWVSFKTKGDYDKRSEEEISAFFRENISWDKKDFDNLTNGIIEQIEKVYEIIKP